MRKLTPAVIAAAAICGLCEGSAYASIIISDPMTTGGSATTLNGTAPAVDNYQSNDVWGSSNATRTTSGTALVGNGTTGQPIAGSLNFSIASATNPATYTLSVTFSMGSATVAGNWLTFGFGNLSDSLTSGEDGVFNRGNSGPSMLIRVADTATPGAAGNNVGDVYNYDTNTAQSSSTPVFGYDSGTSFTTQTFSIVLATGSTDTVAFYETDANPGDPNIGTTMQIGSTDTLTASVITSIRSVDFGANNSATGTATSFLLTSTPEPCALGLLAASSVAMLSRRNARAASR